LHAQKERLLLEAEDREEPTEARSPEEEEDGGEGLTRKVSVAVALLLHRDPALRQTNHVSPPPLCLYCLSAAPPLLSLSLSCLSTHDKTTCALKTL
jgi:hypothetical protein